MELTEEQLNRLPMVLARVVRQDRTIRQMLREPVVTLQGYASAVKRRRELRQEASAVWGPIGGEFGPGGGLPSGEPGLAPLHCTGANLDGANLDGANLDGANLDGANLDGANLDGASALRSADPLQVYISSPRPG